MRICQIHIILNIGIKDEKVNQSSKNSPYNQMFVLCISGCVASFKTYLLLITPRALGPLLPDLLK